MSYSKDPSTPTYKGVTVTHSINNNGLKKLLIIGKTGTGKSTLCNVLTGNDPKAKIFPVSSDAESCTQATKFANVWFNGDKSKHISLIDTRTMMLLSLQNLLVSLEMIVIMSICL